MENIEKIRDDLRGRREEILERQRRLLAELRRNPADENSSYEDLAARGEFDDVVDSLSELELKEIRGIEAALQRIDSGKYGECIECGNAISEERLAAIPYAVYCTPCAEAEGKAARPRR